ncbi:MAG: hypothetical protein Q8P83_00265 [bacterium]|nr:hypothetical protein [bacterium]
MNKYFTHALVALGTLAILGGSVAFAHPPGDPEGFKHQFSELTEEQKAEKKQARLNSQADILGLTVEELKNRLEVGELFREIADAQGLTKEDVHAAMLESVKTRLAEKIASGEITQEDADKKLEWMENHKHGEHKKFKRRHRDRNFLEDDTEDDN